jgi:hypothetical protein
MLLLERCLLSCSSVKSLGTSEQVLRFIDVHPHSLYQSARVMRNEVGESRGFGFVSYQTPDQGSEVITIP